MNVVKFRNSWYSRQSLGPEYYSVRDNEKPEEYKGYFIFKCSNPWVDVVEHVEYDKGNEEFVCVTQRGSVKNAKEWIDSQEFTL